MTIAQRLAKKVSTLNPADKVAMLSYEIGKMTEYTIDETTDEDDCAYGPLLNHKANCDGYSDAFYLCAKLAGINVRYQFGACIGMEGFHLWNLVKINKQWTSVDVTWDSTNCKSDFILWYCMLGNDRVEKFYIWDKDMSPRLAEKTDCCRSSLIPEGFCRSVYDIVNMLRNAKAHDQHIIHLLLAVPSIINDKQVLSDCLRDAGINKSCTYWEVKALNEITIKLNY